MTLHEHTDTHTDTASAGQAGVDRAATEAEAAHYGGTVVRWRTRCDNHEPSRAEDSGYGVRYASHRVTGQEGFAFWPGSEVRDAHNAMYVLDDGHTAVPYFVAAWSDKHGEVILHPFPTNPDGRTRADRPTEVIDFSTWALGPRRCYHLKISPA